MVTYPGLPGPTIGDYLSFEASHERYAPGTEFSIGEIKMVANTGTYLDTPAHRHRGGYDLAGLALRDCAGLPATVVDAEGAIDPTVLDGHEIGGAQFSSAPVSTVTGGPSVTELAATPFAPRKRRHYSSSGERASLASTASTSTTPPRENAPRTLSCSAPVSRS
jgi:hypothetical protein